jgi:sugar O-acyltransferase (sialic acid O-acetyltransferase NeuD family)
MSGELVSVVIYGASGFAAGMRDMIEHGLEGKAFRVAAFIDDFAGDTGKALDDAPIIGFETWRRDYRALPCLISVANPPARRALAQRVAEAGGHFATAYRAFGAISPSIVVGEGTVIGYPAYVGPFTRIGRHVHVMPMSVLGHDLTVGDCVTICSSASIAGYVVIEDDVFVGAGAVIVNGTPDRPMRIGRGAKIAAGAVVTKAVAAGTSVAGNPARPLRQMAKERRVLRAQD